MIIQLIIKQSSLYLVMKKSYESYHQEFNVDDDEALILSNPAIIQFPEPQQAKPNLFSAIASYVPFTRGSTKEVFNKVIVPVPNQHFIMGHGNAVRIYKHWQSDTEQLIHCIECEYQLQFNLKTIKVSPYTRLDSENGLLLLAEDSNSSCLQTLHYQMVPEICLKPVHLLKLPSRINCWAFIQKREILVWCQNMKLYHYELKPNGLKLIQTLDTGIDINNDSAVQDQARVRSTSKSKSLSKSKNQDASKATKTKKASTFVLNYCSILGYRSLDQDSVILLFYVVYNQEFNGMKIKCKQIIYPLENETNEKHYSFLNYGKCKYPALKINSVVHEIVSHNTATPEILNALNIIQIDNAYLIRFEFEIIVVQKKFDQYFAIDNIYKKNKECKVSIANNSNIIACFTQKILELSRAVVKDNKVNSTMIDFIDLQTEYQKMKEAFLKENSQANIQLANFNLQKGKLHQMWVSSDLQHEHHHKNLYFIFDVIYKQNGEEKQAYILYLSKHMQKIKKLTYLARVTKSQQDFLVIQKLGQNLGVGSSQFYYHMWKSSDQGPDDLLAYLLKSEDCRKILMELKGFLRKRSYEATRLWKVLESLEIMTLNLLKQQLTQQNLIDYLHVVFVHRKFRIFESNYTIDERQFTQMSEISIYELAKEKIISNLINPAKKVPSLWTLEAKEPPKLMLIQVFNYFKLPLLQNYDEFLRDILNEHSENIIKILNNFPVLLPIFPLEQIEVEEGTQSASIPLGVQTIKSTKSLVQRQLFTKIQISELKSQPNFLENLLKQLYPYYSTSFILKSFDQVMGRVQMRGQKFKFHSVIETKIDEYKQKIKRLSSINGKFLYIVALDCFVKQSHHEGQYPCQIDKICEVFKQHLSMPESDRQELRIGATLYELMIHHSIIDVEEIGLENIFLQPVEKWMALFFLGNKQQKDLIFNQFRKLFKENNAKFIETIQKFVNSEHCSKIELIILIDLIKEMKKEFQRNNQKIIDVIIDGFCARVQISDTDDTTFFKKRLRTVQLGQELLMKADKIQKLSVCRRILSTFFLEDVLLKDLLYNTISIIDQMLQNYFEGKVRQDKIILPQNVEIGIDQTKGMFKLLHYMRQNIFFNISAEELVITYCQKLIDWQQFDEIHELLYKSNEVEQYGLNTKKLIMDIQSQALQRLYKIENFMLTYENRNFVNHILEIDTSPTNNEIVIEERAKIAISDMFMKWDIGIPIAKLDSMCKDWGKTDHMVQGNENREGFSVMDEIIQSYSDYLNVEKLQQLYFYFTMAVTHKQHFDQDELKTEQYYGYCTSLCDALLVKGRFKEASKIICIINEHYEMNYVIMVECLLKSLVAIYISNVPKLNQSDINFIGDSEIEENGQAISPKHHKIIPVMDNNKNKQMSKIPTFERYVTQHEDQNQSEESEILEQEMSSLEIVKKFVDYFVQNWMEIREDAMAAIYSSYFDTKSLANVLDILEFEVDSANCFFEGYHKLKTKDLWDFVEKVCRAEKVTEKDLVCSYFFLQMGLADSACGFSKINYIEYNHSVLTTVLQKFRDQCDKNPTYFCINYLNIFELYLDALTEQLVNHPKEKPINNDSDNQESNVTSEVQYVFTKNLNLSVVRDELLKKSEYKNDPLTGLILKMKALTVQAKKSYNKKAAKYSLTYTSVTKLDFIQQRNSTQKSLRATIMKKKNDKSVMGHDPLRYVQPKPSLKTMMSFQQFKKMKNGIKNNKTLSMIDPDEMTERVIVQEIFNKMEPQSKPTMRKIEIPGLDKVIEQSLEQQIKKEQEQQLKMKEQLKLKKLTEQDNENEQQIKQQKQKNSQKQQKSAKQQKDEQKKPKNFFQAVVKMSKN